MNEQQCKTIAAMRPKLVRVIKCNIGSYLTWLEINDGISKGQRQLIDALPSSTDKALKLLTTLEGSETGFNDLMQAMQKTKNFNLADELELACNR